MAGTVRQVNFRMDERASKEWEQLRQGSGLKNDELFRRMLENYSTSGVSILPYETGMREVEETLGRAASKMEEILRKSERQHETKMARERD